MACPASLRPGGRATSPTTTLGEALVAAAMVLSLLFGTATALARLALDLPLAMLCAFRTAVAAGRPPCPDPPISVLYYTGTVRHTRRKPAKHAFSYPVRTALVNLDNPPTWWESSGAASDHLTADAARAAAGVVVGDGGEGRKTSPPPPAWVLTSPPAAGYSQNPISVYYVWGEGEGKGGGGGAGRRTPPTPLPTTPPAFGVAVVTNTPWGARVAFRFDPAGDKVAKCLHVSPFMDMEGTWILSATPPGRRLHLAVGVDHPQLGRFFDATLDADCDGWDEDRDGRGAGASTTLPSSSPFPPPAARSERGALRTLLAYGYMPHRTAAWIYWHAAVLLLWRGLALFSPPARGGDAARTRAGGAGGRAGGPADTRPVDQGGRGHAWTPAGVWPWSAQQ